MTGILTMNARLLNNYIVQTTSWQMCAPMTMRKVGVFAGAAMEPKSLPDKPAEQHSPSIESGKRIEGKTWEPLETARKVKIIFGV